MIRTRILTNVVGASTDYGRGQIVNLADAAANNLIAGGFAMKDVPSASGVISLHLAGAGYTEVTPGPSGYGFVGPSGIVSNPPADGGYYFESENIIRIVFPGEVEERFEILKLLPKP